MLKDFGMKVKEGLRLRKLGRRYMLVRTAEQADLSEVFTFNEVAASIWEKAAEADEIDVDALVGHITEEYDVDEATARKDIVAILEEWKRYGIVE